MGFSETTGFPSPALTPPLVPFGRDSRFGEEWLHLFLLIRHVRKMERLASFRQRDLRIAQAFIMFTLLGVVFFLRQRCAPGRRFPCGLALGSHVVLFHFLTSTFFPGRGDPSAMAANLWPPPSPSNRRNCGYRMPSIGSSWIADRRTARRAGNTCL